MNYEGWVLRAAQRRREHPFAPLMFAERAHRDSCSKSELWRITMANTEFYQLGTKKLGSSLCQQLKLHAHAAA